MRKIASICLLLVLTMSLSGCEIIESSEKKGTAAGSGQTAVTDFTVRDSKEPDSGPDLQIESFSYEFYAFLSDYLERKIKITRENGKNILRYWTREIERTYGAQVETEVSDEFMNKLKDLYTEYKLSRWDGFDKRDENIYDGGSFYLDIALSDGKTVSAYGYMKWPDNYYEFIEAMDVLIDPEKERAIQEKKQAVIDEGLIGPLKSADIFIRSKGEYEPDGYSFTFSRNPDGTVKYYVDVSSESGEYFDTGNPLWPYTRCNEESLPADAVDFEAIDALIRKYDVITWHGSKGILGNWHDNEDYFYIEAVYDNVTIKAGGNELPENFGEFRKELLTLLERSVYETADKYQLEQ